MESGYVTLLDVMAYAPGIWSSYVYAGVAARAAVWLEPRNAGLSGVYRTSALAAANWAESNRQAYIDDLLATYGKDPPYQLNDARNLAAAEIFRLTGDTSWHDIFIATTVFVSSAANVNEGGSHDQRDAAFVYARTDRAGVDEAVKQNAENATLREASWNVNQGRRTAFHWTKLNEWLPVGRGILSTPQVKTILRAHVLTGDGQYIEAAVKACQMGAGANPANMCYTTGVGPNPPKHPMIVDARISCQEAPPGITVYGPLANTTNPPFVLLTDLYPGKDSWPTTEAYFDVYWFAAVCEFTVMQTMGPNAYAWGYLAAQDPPPAPPPPPPPDGSGGGCGAGAGGGMGLLFLGALAARAKRSSPVSRYADASGPR